MKIFTQIIFLLSFLVYHLSADDGNRQIFSHVEMNINNSNYVLFEDNSLIVCDRDTDEYLAEISEDYDLFVKGKKVDVNDNQRKLLEEYYEAQYELFSSRNLIGAKGIEIGMQSAGLALKAVGGAFVVMASGFDEEKSQEFEEAMEYEAEKIEDKANELEEHAENFENQILIVNRTERKIRKEIEALDRVDLYVDEDSLSISVK